ncbi:MAG: single-stranded DNA-binding protein [Clostridiales bacterium]|nr:single-stranded DNA-binding protein [Clostridiales bacterium]
MASLNKVILIGHLTADPELKQTQTGVAVTSFSIGVTRKYSKNGEQAQSDFINIVAWRQNAEFICKYFKKGNAICICGSIQTRSYDANDGTKRYITEVVADEATFVEKKSDRSDDYQAPAFSTDAKSDAAPKFEEIAEDGDLPF